MNKTLEKSQEQADIIQSIAIYILLFDVEYCKEAANDMIQQAQRQESIMVLNPSYPQIKNEILRTQGQALEFLCKYKEALMEVEKLKSELSKEQENRDVINRMFI